MFIEYTIVARRLADEFLWRPIAESREPRAAFLEQPLLPAQATEAAYVGE
jgi:hypothetical protein